MTMAMATGAWPMNRPWLQISANFVRVSRSWITMKCQHWVLLELGDQRPAWRILMITSSGTGSGLNSLTVRRLLMHW
jgi:hypothetical protein